MKNCFTYYPYRWRYYVKKPWEFFEDIWLNLKAAWQRATRGWADRDTWNLDYHLLDILPEMIDYLREHTHGYPGGHQGFPTYESWQDFLQNEIVIPLQNAREEQTTQINEYEEEYFNLSSPSGRFLNTRSDDEVREKWLAREQEISEWRQQELERGLQNLATVFFNLWD